MDLGPLLPTLLHGVSSFGTVPFCVACQMSRANCGLKYCELKCLRSAVGIDPDAFVDGTEFGGRGIPHIHVSCLRCGFTWLERPAFGSRP